jgi:hypothetical protein
LLFKHLLRTSALAVVVGGAASSFGLTFNFTYDLGISAQALAVFQKAASHYSSLFTDDMTVNIEIAYSNMGSGYLGQSSSEYKDTTYTALRNALTTDKKSANDAIAVSNLQTGTSLNLVTNRFTNNPNGSTSATPYTTSLSAITLTTANAKALGLLSGSSTASDGSIQINSYYGWDFDQSNGIDSNKFDLTATIEHELGHALGFTSGVDEVEFYGPEYSASDTTWSWVNPLDLFRYASGSSIPYLTADKTAKYFSLDKGATGTSYLFSTGTTYGDGWQASHWKDDLGLGTMDPTGDYGELSLISNLDITAWDVIGYDLKPVPEPATLATLAFGALAVIARRRRRK